MNLEANPQSHQIKLEPNDSRQLANLCGPFDSHLRQIEKRLGVTIRNRGNDFQLIGEQPYVAGELLTHLYWEVNNGTCLPSVLVHFFL